VSSTRSARSKLGALAQPLRGRLRRDGQPTARGSVRALAELVTCEPCRAQNAFGPCEVSVHEPDETSESHTAPVAPVTAGRVARGARRRISAPLERVGDWRLEREQQRGELGPAHLRWRGNSASENRARWNGWDWSRRGEEWTASEDWKQSLIDDVLLALIPAGTRVLEIGPGAGRWSTVLQPRAARLVLVDVSQRALDLSRERLAGTENVEYVLSSGSDLPGVADRSIEAVWSFDVFVHIAPRDQAGYVREVARVLAPGGIAVIHHADGRNRGELPSRRGWRSPMSRRLFAALAAENGLVVEAQIDSWGPEHCHDLSAFHDAITVCRRPADPR
jgi:SAM-dependent methyltransferase